MFRALLGRILLRRRGKHSHSTWLSPRSQLWSWVVLPTALCEWDLLQCEQRSPVFGLPCWLVLLWPANQPQPLSTWAFLSRGNWTGLVRLSCRYVFYKGHNFGAHVFGIVLYRIVIDMKRSQQIAASGRVRFEWIYFDRFSIFKKIRSVHSLERPVWFSHKNRSCHQRYK